MHIASSYKQEDQSSVDPERSIAIKSNKHSQDDKLTNQIIKQIFSLKFYLNTQSEAKILSEKNLIFFIGK